MDEEKAFLKQNFMNQNDNNFYLLQVFREVI